MKVGSDQGSLAAAGFVLGVWGGQRYVVFREVGYVDIIGLWCGKWVLIIRGRKLGGGLYGFLGEDGVIFIGCSYRWIYGV